MFLFSDQPSKGSGCPFSEAKQKATKVVKFMAMWLNLYPRTVPRKLQDYRASVHTFFTLLSNEFFARAECMSQK